MKKIKVLSAIVSGLVALTLQGHAQTIYQVTFKGSVETTNANGDIVSQKLNNQTYLQDAATATGATNSTSLNLVYVQNASSDPSANGDFIEVVSGTNNTPIYTNLQFMYGGTSFPPALTNSSGTQIAIGAQVIPQPLAGSGQSLGGATINERIMQKKTVKTVIMGSFNYTSLQSAGTTNAYDSVRFYTGTFNVGKPLATP